MKKNPGRKEQRWETKKRRTIPSKAAEWLNHRNQVERNREHKQLLKKLIPYWAHKKEWLKSPAEKGMVIDNGQDT